MKNLRITSEAAARRVDSVRKGTGEAEGLRISIRNCWCVNFLVKVLILLVPTWRFFIRREA